MNKFFSNIKTLQEWEEYLICSENEIKTLVKKGTLEETPLFKEEYNKRKGQNIKARLYNHKFLNPYF